MLVDKVFLSIFKIKKLNSRDTLEKWDLPGDSLTGVKGLSTKSTHINICNVANVGQYFLPGM
jgi:hypothetical protein